MDMSVDGRWSLVDHTCIRHAKKTIRRSKTANNFEFRSGPNKPGA
jgi:hypothetical protein